MNPLSRKDRPCPLCEGSGEVNVLEQCVNCGRPGTEVLHGKWICWRDVCKASLETKVLSQANLAKMVQLAKLEENDPDYWSQFCC